MSFTKIEPATLVRVCYSIPNLRVLDVSGIKLTLEHCAHVLTRSEEHTLTSVAGSIFVNDM